MIVDLNTLAAGINASLQTPVVLFLISGMIPNRVLLEDVLKLAFANMIMPPGTRGHIDKIVSGLINNQVTSVPASRAEGVINVLKLSGVAFAYSNDEDAPHIFSAEKTISADSEPLQRVEINVCPGHKIYAIKVVRAITNTGLREAKDFVEGETTLLLTRHQASILSAAFELGGGSIFLV